MFKANVGPLDRLLRLAAGVALLGLFFLFPDTSWRWAALIGVVPLATGALGTCPLYSVLGLSTRPVSEA